ncbi:mCG57126 [Mus musculus]|nr:mCG57126 [Mus musculus]
MHLFSLKYRMARGPLVIFSQGAARSYKPETVMVGPTKKGMMGNCPSNTGALGAAPCQQVA